MPAWGLFVVAGPVAFALAWVIAGLLQPGFDPLRYDESSLAATGAAHPWFTMVGDTAVGLAVLVLGVGLGRLLTGRRRVIGSVLLVIAGLAVVVQALVREDCIPQLRECGGSSTTIGTWHQGVHDGMSVLAFLGILIAALVLVPPLREQGWPRLARWSKLAGVIGFVLLVAYTPLSDSTVGGLAELIFLIVPVGWIAMCGVGLQREVGRQQE